MAANGQLREGVADGGVLRWPGRVVAAEELRRSLNGHRELVVAPEAVVTPLAMEELRSRGVRIHRLKVPDSSEARRASTMAWGYGSDQPNSVVQSAIQAARREGLALQELSDSQASSPGPWARAVAECIARDECRGGVLFCQDPGLVCCVANKVTGLRAVAATTVAQAARATLTLGANLVAVEMPGRTFFEVRQILRTLCRAADPVCPPGVACTLQELDGHAHR